MQAQQTELLERLDAEIAKIRGFEEHFVAELALPNPQITQNGHVIAEGDKARKILQDILAANRALYALRGDIVRQIGD